MNKKVLFIDTSKIWGGAEIYLYEYVSKLIEIDNLDVFVASSFVEKYQKILGTNFIQIDVGSLRKSFPVSNILKLFKQGYFISRLIKNNNIDFVVANNPRSYVLSIFLKILNPKLRIMFIVHEMIISKVLLKLFSIFAMKIIFVSDFVQNKYSNISKGKSLIIQNAFDFDKIRSLAIEDVGNFTDKVRNKKVVGMAGYFYKWKGQLEFLKAAKVLLDENSDISFILIGGPKDEDNDSLTYFEEIKKFIRTNGLESNVYITGSAENPYKYMNICDLLIHASLDPEPFGRVIVEYMILGKPVLISKYAESFDCRKIDPKDADGFAQSMRNIVDSSASYNQPNYDLSRYDIRQNVEILGNLFI